MKIIHFLAVVGLFTTWSCKTVETNANSDIQDADPALMQSPRECTVASATAFGVTNVKSFEALATANDGKDYMIYIVGVKESIPSPRVGGSSHFIIGCIEITDAANAVVLSAKAQCKTNMPAQYLFKCVSGVGDNLDQNWATVNNNGTDKITIKTLTKDYLFAFTGNDWTKPGKALFNLTPTVQISFGGVSFKKM